MSSRAAALLVAAAGLALVAPAVASASSLVMHLGSPVLGVVDHTTFDVTTSDPSDKLVVITRQGNGPPCQRSSFDDYGAYADGPIPYDFMTPDDVPVSGTTTVPVDYTWNAYGSDTGTGPWTVCAWVHHLDNGEVVDAMAGQVVNVSGPTGTLSLSARSTPSIGTTFVAAARGTAGGVDEVFEARVRRAGGAPCAATPGADPGTVFEPVDLSVAGPYSVHTNSHSVFAKHWGRYLVCGWLTSRGKVLASASTTVTHYVAPMLRRVPELRLRTTPLRPGVRVRCTPGRWTASPRPRFSYRWLRNRRRIHGARGRTYRVRRADRGRLLRCLVIAHNPGGRAEGPSGAVPVARR